MAFDIQFWKQCCSVKHDWMNFNYVLFESILIILHEINMIIVTHPHSYLSIVSGFWFFFFLGHIVKAFQNNVCVYHLYRNVFLAQTRIRSHLGCIFLFRNSFQYPQSKHYSKRVSKRPFSSCCVYHRSLSIASTSLYGRLCHCGAALRNFIRNTMHFKAFQNRLCVYHLYRNVFLAQTRIRSPFFPAFQKGVSNPLIKIALRLSSAKITLKVVWKPYFYTRKVVINAPFFRRLWKAFLTP